MLSYRFPRLSEWSPCSLILRLEGVWWFWKQIIAHIPFFYFCTSEPFPAYEEVAKESSGSYSLWSQTIRLKLSKHHLLPDIINILLTWICDGIHYFVVTHLLDMGNYSLFFSSPLHFPVSAGLMKRCFIRWIISSTNLGGKREWEIKD